MNLNQVTVAAHDLPKSVAFYQTLGLTLIVDTPHYARFECPDGESTFSLHKVDQKPPINDTIIYFECQQLDHEYRRLLSAGIEFIQEPTDQRWLWREARLYDPSDNQICLFWGGENRKNPPWRVN
ncbi:VOC family protein [Pseudoteredinibacter isoporae]|uniref:VOC family protein n=1 Tax=Pseudoteredinibacter isoporae TaxID=570281 RepID=UPI003106DBF4